MKQETKESRDKRIQERRAVKELNDTGRRLFWVRMKLKLMQREIAQATGIPQSSYNDRESGIRTDYYEEHIVLSAYLNTLWQQKYPNGIYPSFEGHQVSKIDPMWLQYGKLDKDKDIDLINKEFQLKIAQMQKEAYEREQNLKRQLDLLDFLPNRSA